MTTLVGLKSAGSYIVLVMVVATAAACDEIRGEYVEYTSSNQAHLDAYARAASELGYKPREITNAKGQPSIAISGVRARDSRKLECTSLRIGLDSLSPPAYKQRMDVACAPE